MAEELREVLGEAVTQHEEPTTEPVEPAKDETPDEPTDTKPAEEAQEADEKGADTTAEEEAGEPEDKAAEQAGEPKAGEREAGPTYKAPKSWKPGPREKWSSLPPDIQQEISRREGEIRRGMRETTEARHTAAQFKETIQPFMQLIEADQSTPMEAVKNLMQTAAGLRLGTPAQKVGIVADVINRFGVDIQMLDNALAGKMQHDPVAQQVQQQLAPMQQLMQQMQAREQAQTQQFNQEAEESIQDFADDPENEFFEDVREDMADIIDRATARGQRMSLKDAYNRAIMLNDDIAEVVSQRKVQAQLAKSQEPVANAKKAAVSVKGAPTVGEATSGSSVRDSIINAIESQ